MNKYFSALIKIFVAIICALVNHQNVYAFVPIGTAIVNNSNSDNQNIYFDVNTSDMTATVISPEDAGFTTSYAGKIRIQEEYEGFIEGYGRSRFKVTAIGNAAFLNSQVEEVIIPQTVEEIRDKAFENCRFLRSAIILGRSCNHIGANAFYGCPELNVFWFNPCEPDEFGILYLPYLGTNAFSSTSTIYVLNDYKYKLEYNFNFQPLIVLQKTFQYTGCPDIDIKALLPSDVLISLNKNDLPYKCGSYDGVLDVNFVCHDPLGWGDYVDTFSIPYNCTIIKAPLTFYLRQATRLYGDSNPQFYIQKVSGFQNGETITDLNSQPYFFSIANEKSNVGDYPISVSGESENYTFLCEGSMTVEAAPIEVRCTNSMSIYGDSISFDYTVSGLKNNDPKTPLTPFVFSGPTPRSDVGEYVIEVSGGSYRNYTITNYLNGKHLITPAPIILRVIDASRLYFEENPTFDYTLSGLRNSDTESCLITQPTFKCSATKTSDAGEYMIEPSNASARNYTFEYQAGSLMVNQRELTASVGDYTRVYGTDNPDFVVTYDGFVNDENESVLTMMADADCSANQDSDAGVYPIYVSGGEALNYIITKYNSGTLTIEKSDQTLTWDQDLSNVQQYSQVALEATSSSGLPVSYEMSPNNVATLYNNAGTWFLDCYGMGAVNIRAIQNGDKNYNAAPILTKTLVVIGDGGTPSNPSIFLNVENAGTLSSLIAENRKYQIKNLRLTGYLNGTDINFLREMAGSDCDGNTTSGILEILDISGCTIVSGGRSYYKSYQTADYKIGDYMFYNCKVLTNIMLPDNTTEIKDYAFADCNRLSVISIPNGVNSFGKQLFRNDISLQRVPMPNSLTSIGDYAFMGCNGITEITLPLNVSYIGDGIVKDCQNIARINVEAGNSYFASDNGVLYTSALDELLIFPVNYNSSVYAVLDGTTKIASCAFLNANKLTDVILPLSLLTIGEDAFIGCVNLSSIDVKALKPPICDNDCFEAVSKSRCELIVPRGCYSYYWVAPVWSEFNKIREFENSVNVAEMPSDAINVFTEEHNIVIKGIPIGVQVCIFQMDGTLVYIAQSDGNEIMYQPASFGTYLVIVNNKIYKVLIR